MADRTEPHEPSAFQRSAMTDPMGETTLLVVILTPVLAAAAKAVEWSRRALGALRARRARP